jgi:hypothetical protein
VSIQTDRRKKPELTPLPNLNGVPELEEESEKEKYTFPHAEKGK